jgi:hypothetical protein
MVLLMVDQELATIIPHPLFAGRCDPEKAPPLLKN